MASVTLSESAKLAQDELVAGVIENVVTVDQFYELLPFDGIDGNALAYNRENALGNVMNLGVGGTITAKGAATFTQVTSSLTTIIGDAEVNGLIQATRSGDGNDQTAIQIASKAKSAGRQYRNHLINGTGADDQFNGLINLCAAGQEVETDTNGENISFDVMDQLMDTVVDKDGQVDYFLMPARTRRSYRALLRALGGASINEVFELPSGDEVIAYSGIPCFRNDYIPVNQTQGGASTCTTVFAGTLDDGSRTHGIAGLTAENMAGLHVDPVGWSETKDEFIHRVKWYCGLALFSEKGLAMAPGILN
jgi:hypothetical protein